MCALMSRSRAPSDRVRLLADACADDAAMREEVEALLASHDDAGDVFERQPPADSALARAGIAPAPTHLAAGQRLGPFEIVETVGAGGCRRAGSGEAGSDSARSQPLPSHRAVRGPRRLHRQLAGRSHGRQPRDLRRGQPRAARGGLHQRPAAGLRRLISARYIRGGNASSRTERHGLGGPN